MASSAGVGAQRLAVLGLPGVSGTFPVYMGGTRGPVGLGLAAVIAGLRHFLILNYSL